MFGRIFTREPDLPVIAEICSGYERAEILPFFDNPPIMSNEFYKALYDAGAVNLDVYEAEIRSEDGTVVYTGFKAVNIIGLVRLSGDGTVFGGTSKLIDAGIKKFEINTVIDARAPLIFRTAEDVAAIVVHEYVKKAIAAKGFPYIEFIPAEEYFSL